MLRMEIALFFVLAFVAYIYFSAEWRTTLLHEVFSVLLIAMMVHLLFDAATIYTVNHLSTVPILLNDILHRFFIGTIVLIVYLFYQYIAVLVEEETGQPRQLDKAARLYLLIAQLGVLLLPVHYAVTTKGNYSDGIHASVCYVSMAFYLFLCMWLLVRSWKQIDTKKKFAIGAALVIEVGVSLLQAVNPTWLISGMGLMCYRYPKLQFEYDIDPDLGGMQVPNFILQPIVENSLLHGLKNRGYQGKVHIFAQKTADEHLEICVCDTGSGFAEGKKEMINQMLMNYAKQNLRLEGNSIGILNVQKRIKMLCGRKFGLWYTENTAGGVTAHLLLPLKEEMR